MVGTFKVIYDIVATHRFEVEYCGSCTDEVRHAIEDEFNTVHVEDLISNATKIADSKIRIRSIEAV